jgi:hypothetical protein
MKLILEIYRIIIETLFLNLLKYGNVNGIKI